MVGSGVVKLFGLGIHEESRVFRGVLGFGTRGSQDGGLVVPIAIATTLPLTTCGV